MSATRTTTRTDGRESQRSRTGARVLADVPTRDQEGEVKRRLEYLIAERDDLLTATSALGEAVAELEAALGTRPEFGPQLIKSVTAKPRRRLAETRRNLKLLTNLIQEIEAQLQRLTEQNIRARKKVLKESERAGDGLPQGLKTRHEQLVFPAASVAAHLDISRSRIEQLVKQGRIYGVKPGRDLFVSLEEVERYIAANPKHPGGRPTRSS